MQIKCLDFSLAIVYLFLVSAFLLWGFVYRKKRAGPSRTKTMLNVRDDKNHNSGDKKEAPSQVFTWFVI